MEQEFGPYLEIARIQSEMNKLFDVLHESRDEMRESGASGWIPSVDVCQTAKGLVVRAEVPGVPEKSLRLSALGGALIIQGERPADSKPGKSKFHCAERVHGRFRRVVPLGVPINTRDASATLANGVVEVFFPKVPNRRGEEVVIPLTLAEGVK